MWVSFSNVPVALRENIFELEETGRDGVKGDVRN